MGRYYYGQISGKFWFGIQNSDDATNFGVDYKNIYYFYACNCQIYDGVDEDVDEDDDEDVDENLGTDIVRVHDKIYCKDCYSSYEEHLQAIIEEGIEIEDDECDKSTKNNTWYKSSSEIEFYFDMSHIELIEKHIKILEDAVGKYMIESFKIIDEDDGEITYDYMMPINISTSEIELLARLCLGKQILYCLHKNESCCFSAEL